MMAGSTGTLTAMYPEMADKILALAGGSSVLITVDGVWMNILVALPLANAFYRFLTREKKEKTATKEEK